MKTVLLTFLATLAGIAIIVYFLFNPILGAFGLAAVSVGTLQQLKVSHDVVERMRTRHSEKKLHGAKRLVTRSARRVTSTALAAVQPASSFAVVAVVAAMTSLEVADYCEDKKDLMDDANILYGTHTSFDMKHCAADAKEDVGIMMDDLRRQSGAGVRNALSMAAQYSAPMWVQVKRSSMQAMQTTEEAAEGFWDVGRSFLPAR